MLENEQNTGDHTQHPMSLPNSDFPSAAVTGRPSLANDDAELISRPHAEDKAGPVTTSATVSQDEWKAGKQEWLIVVCLGIVSLMVALDATIVVPALPVRQSAIASRSLQIANSANTEHCGGHQSEWCPKLLDRRFVLAHLRRRSASSCITE